MAGTLEIGLWDALTLVCGFAVAALTTACAGLLLWKLALEVREALSRRHMGRERRLARRRRWMARSVGKMEVLQHPQQQDAQAEGIDECTSADDQIDLDPDTSINDGDGMSDEASPLIASGMLAHWEEVDDEEARRTGASWTCSHCRCVRYFSQPGPAERYCSYCGARMIDIDNLDI